MCERGKHLTAEVQSGSEEAWQTGELGQAAPMGQQPRESKGGFAALYYPCFPVVG